MAETLSPPYLTESEIDELCFPLVRRSAQLRHLCMLLRVDTLPQRPDGLPLVGRKMIEGRLNGDDTAGAAGFNWTK